MFFNINEDAAEVQANDIDVLVPQDDNTEAGIEVLADEVEKAMQSQALESVTYFNNGEEALKNFMESANVLLEARKISKRTFIKLGKNDDLERRTHLACLVLAKNANDPLFRKLAQNRVKERKLRALLFKKYGQKATKVARVSQKKHIKELKKMPALPAFNPQ